MWEEIGELQFEFLKARGLRADNLLLDIGCGALRGGIHFIRYLDTGNYFGVDINGSLIDAGRMELSEASLEDRRPTLRVDGDFAFDALGTRFRFALAQSVFTHLPLNRIERCLVSVSRVLEPGGRFFASYFEAPRRHHIDALRHDPGGIVTHSDADPFHYHPSAFEWLTRELPLQASNLGGWGHPRSQHMLEFIRK